MPFTHEWYDADRTVIHSQIIAPWTWDAYISELDTLFAMMDEVEHPVISLGDYRRAGPAPSGIITRLPAIAKLMTHPNFHKFILVGVTSSLGRSGVRVFSNVYGKVDYVDTLEEADDIIKAEGGHYADFS
jgi:hypothetical protein